jgi:phospholipid/cholesterol/gamma-HCH transport system substrate-binding protein
MKSLEFDIKIGLFILIGLIIMTVITFSINDFFFKPGYNLYVKLGFANGIQQSAPVRLAGISIGEVKEASVFKNEDGKTMVKLKLWLMNDAKVEKDSNVIINTLGLIGEKYVEIIPGTPGTELASDGDSIAGHDSVSVEQITKKSYEIALKLEKAIEHMDDILSQVKSGRGTIGRLIYDETLYNESEGMMKDLRANPWKLLMRPSGVERKRAEDVQKAPKMKTNFNPAQR